MDDCCSPVHTLYNGNINTSQNNRMPTVKVPNDSIHSHIDSLCLIYFDSLCVSHSHFYFSLTHSPTRQPTHSLTHSLSFFCLIYFHSVFIAFTFFFPFLTRSFHSLTLLSCVFSLCLIYFPFHPFSSTRIL